MHLKILMGSRHYLHVSDVANRYKMVLKMNVTMRDLKKELQAAVVGQC